MESQEDFEVQDAELLPGELAEGELLRVNVMLAKDQSNVPPGNNPAMEITVTAEPHPELAIAALQLAHDAVAGMAQHLIEHVRNQRRNGTNNFKKH